MYDELVRELRGEYGYDTRKDIRVMKAAADAIEDLQKRVPKRPHGRLIDADALMENEENISFKDEWRMTVTEAFVSVKNIADAPTIIEAEEGE